MQGEELKKGNNKDKNDHEFIGPDLLHSNSDMHPNVLRTKVLVRDV
jgi:hypothetical protein